MSNEKRPSLARVFAWPGIFHRFDSFIHSTCSSTSCCRRPTCFSFLISSIFLYLSTSSSSLSSYSYVFADNLWLGARSKTSTILMSNGGVMMTAKCYCSPKQASRHTQEHKWRLFDATMQAAIARPASKTSILPRCHLEIAGQVGGEVCGFQTCPRGSSSSS